MVTEQQKQAFQKKVLDWYAENKRDLPWRTTTDPYAILVSEMMLQQTQVDRVIPYYLRFMSTFQDFQALANADKKLLLEHWSGLGYNNRVLRLQKLAQTLIAVNTPFPQTEEELLALPGIGPYTAAAVLAFAFNQPAVVIDTNIRRVLIAEFQLAEDTPLEKLKKLAKELIPRWKSCLWHNALMDYGALQATARKTGISSLSKQSKFEGSERQVRGKIVKHLLKESAASVKSLEELYPHSKFSVIVEKLEREGVIVCRGEIISFS